LHYIHNLIEDYPGLWCNGSELVDRLQRQLTRLEIIPHLGVEIRGIDPSRSGLYLDHKWLDAKAIVIATGARRRKLQVEGAESLLGKGISYTYNGDKALFTGRDACIIGGGDGAFENALMMADICKSVTIIYRGAKARSRRDFVSRVTNHPKIKLMPKTEVLAIQGTQWVEGLWLEQIPPISERDDDLVQTHIEDIEQHHQLPSITQGREFMPANAVLIKIGFELQSDWLAGHCLRTDTGHICVDQEQRTSLHNVWAVGDICALRDPSLSVAVGHGCIAMRSIERMLSAQCTS
jgi:thioredoxin reductase (NADPH)